MHQRSPLTAEMFESLLKEMGLAFKANKWPRDDFGYIVEYASRSHKTMLHIDHAEGGNWLNIRAESYLHPRDPRNSKLSTDVLMGRLSKIPGIGAQGASIGPLNETTYMWGNRSHLRDDEVNVRTLKDRFEAVAEAQKRGFEIADQELDATGEPR